MSKSSRDESSPRISVGAKTSARFLLVIRFSRLYLLTLYTMKYYNEDVITMSNEHIHTVEDAQEAF